MMKKYKVQWNYTSSLGGPWKKGEVVELEEELAERVNIDSPGVLKGFRGAKSTKGGRGASKDRQKTKAKSRSKPKQEVMTPEEPGYGKELVKDKE